MAALNMLVEQNKKTDSPAITIIMPCLNSIQYIRESVNSIINQTFSDFELIVADAGSNDGTYEILKEYARLDSRVRILQSARRSMGAQYNMGIDAANGMYVGFVESDDYIEAEMLEKLYKAITKYRVDYVKSNFSFFVDLPDKRLFADCSAIGESRVSYYNRVLSSAEISDFSDYDKYIWHGLYNKVFLKRNGIKFQETDGASFQDAGFIFQVYIFAGSAYYLEKSLYKYRRDNVNASVFTKNTYRHAVNEFEYVLNILLKEKNKFELFAPKLLRKFYVLFHDCMKAFLAAQNYSEDLRLETAGFISKLKHIYDALNTCNISRSGLWPPQDILLLFENFEEYCSVTKKRAHSFSAIQVAAVKEFSQYKKVMVCGNGEISACVSAYLKRNGIHAIVTLNEMLAVNSEPDVLYLLTQGGTADELAKNRLMRSGVPLRLICYYGSGFNVHNWSELPVVPKLGG